MRSDYSIRLITEQDAAEVLGIYEPNVRDTVISFEYEIPSLDEYLQRIRTNTMDYPWLLCLEANKIIGFAYGSRHRYRTAYQWSPESTVYLLPEAQGKGIGRLLYEVLFDLLRLQGYFNVYAGVVLPNQKSVAFHRALGFDEIGTFKKVGYKLGNWHDTLWFQLHLRDHIPDPPAPMKLNEVVEDARFQNILAQANRRIETTAAGAGADNRTDQVKE
jgi:L-amino acid N-acyltransferase YncA